MKLGWVYDVTSYLIHLHIFRIFQSQNISGTNTDICKRQTPFSLFHVSLCDAPKKSRGKNLIIVTISSQPFIQEHTVTKFRQWKMWKCWWHLAFSVSSQAIRDLHLLVIVAGLLAVDVVFLSCWIAIDPLQAEILPFKDMVRNTHSSLLTLNISARSPFESKNVPNWRDSKTNSLFSTHTCAFMLLALNVPHIVRLKRNIYSGVLSRYERSPSCIYRAIYTRKISRRCTSRGLHKTRTGPFIRARLI